MAKPWAGNAIEINSSPKVSAAGTSTSVDDDFDMDFEIDSDLEAMIAECSQPESAAATDQPDCAATQSSQSSSRSSQKQSKTLTQQTRPHGRRRAISDRPRFKLARPQQHHTLDTHVNTIAEDHGDRGELWWQRYVPKSVDELAIHGSKIAQVRGWLEMASDAAINGGSRGTDYFRILVLEGPAGSCKSTCVRVLADQLGLEIIEWINPLSGRLSDAAQNEDTVGVVRAFEEFLSQAERYTGIQMQQSDGINNGSKGKLILIDDLPNIGHRDTRLSFGKALTRFSMLPARGSFPMVIIVTESFAAQQVLDDGGRDRFTRRFRETDTMQNADISIWSAMDVLPGGVYNSSYCQCIKFNPVAPTIVVKGLKRILLIRNGLNVKGAKFTSNCTNVLKGIADECQGDLRLAVTMLQVSQAGNQIPISLDSNLSVGKKRRIGMESVDINSNTGGETRRTTLDLFHALGKVLYAKRTLVGSEKRFTRGRLESDPDEILDRLPMDLSTFGLYVHENYTDFCSNIEEAAQASEYFSDADLFANGRHGAAAGFLDVYGGMLSVRGFMHTKDNPGFVGSALPNVNRNIRGMTAFRKPLFFEMYRQRVTNSRTLHDEAGVELLRIGGLGLARSMEKDVVLDVLPYWVRINTRPECVAIRQHPAIFQRLVALAMPEESAVGDILRLAASTARTTHPPFSGADPQEMDQKLELSDDDVEDFSE